MRAVASKVRRAVGALWLPIVLAASLHSGMAHAQSSPVIAKGDAAVTQFSGTAAPASVPKDVHPLDLTVIDLQKPTLQVFDMSKLGDGPNGQLADAPSKLKIKAGEIGQVFGVTLDSGTETAPPNIYAAATSLFGLQIVDGEGANADRLVKGASSARWMPGQFGAGLGGGPGAIYKIDGSTGAVSLFSTVVSGNQENAGPGLGGLAFDPLSHMIYAANLETGMIHRLDIAGRELSIFDHGVTARTRMGLDAVIDDPAKRMSILSPQFSVEKPDTWGYAEQRRRVVALAVEDGRLYYSVADGPVMWSVGLTADGDFLDDARLEIDVVGTPNNGMVTAIAFDGPDAMFISQRGETAGSYEYSTFARPQQSVVYRFKYDASAKAWSEVADETAIGLEAPHRASNGGLALGYGYDAKGNIDYGACRETLWTSGEHLRQGPDSSGEKTIHGLQGNRKSIGIPATPAQPRSGSAALNSGGQQIAADSALDAPNETWFTDNDGRFDDKGAHGPIGAVAVYTKCDERQASAEPERPVDYERPARKMPGIFIDKDCFPSAFGGVVQCRITVTNTGITPYDAVSFTDASTVLAGVGAGGAVAVQSFTPDAPGWFCTPAPTTAFQCTLPAGTLTAGTSRFVDVFINTGPLSVAGGLGFRNCATTLAPYGDRSCSEFSNGTTGLIISKTGPAQCNPGTPCVFALSVKNNGTQPFAGNVQISDAMFVGGVSVPAPITATNLTCTGGNPPALPFTCVTPLTLGPGITQTFSMTVTMPAAPPNYWAQNCFAAFDPTFAPPGGPLPSPGGPGGAGFGSPTNPACAWVAAGNPPPQSNLRITKTPLAGTCASSLLTGIASCKYQIRVSNDGPTPFNSPITINEVPPVGSNMILNPAWPCVAAAPGFNCTSPAPIAIAPGAAFTLTATIQIPPLLTQPSCLVPNTVTIAAPLGAPQNISAADDTSTASMSTALLAVLNPDGTVSVACDPTNLKTTKAVVSCTDDGTSLACKHTITVTNTGPDPYQGPINIADEYSIAPSNVSFPADWACNAAGSGFLCTKPGIQLVPPGKPGQNSITLEVTATVPKANNCSLTNTATMTFPPANTPFNLRGDDDQSSVSSPIASPECDKRPVCDQPGPDEFKSASGACVCKVGTSRQRDGKCLSDGVTTDEPEPATPDRCPDGNPIPKSGACPCDNGQTWDDERKVCAGSCDPGPNEYRSSAGQCVCKTGYSRSDDGSCSEPGDGPSNPPVRPPLITPDPLIDQTCIPGPNEFRTSRGRCVCRDGFDRDRRGRCVPEYQPDPEPPIERCDINEYRSSRGYCVCDSGFERDRLGECVPEWRPEPETCGSHEFLSSRGYCVCDRGYDRDDRGRCVIDTVYVCKFNQVFDKWINRCIDIRPPEPERCGDNERPTSRGYCICDRGYDRNAKGRCVKFDEPQRPDTCDAREERNVFGRCVCKKGYTEIKGQCVERRQECQKGYTGTFPNCRKIDDGNNRPDTKSCGPHSSRKGNECVCDRGYSYQDSNDCRPNGPSPATECKDRGGRWNDGRCIVEEKPATPKVCDEGYTGQYPDCKPIKKPLDDTPPIKKPTPAQACADRGGSYEEGTCVLPKKKDDDTNKPKDPASTGKSDGKPADQKKIDEQKRLEQKKLEKIQEQNKLQKLQDQKNQQQQDQKKLEKQKEQKKLEKQQEQKKLEKLQDQKKQQQQEQKKIEKQQEQKKIDKQKDQKQQQQDKKQQEKKQDQNKQEQKKQQEQKKNDKGGKGNACPPGKFPNPAKGGKCTKPS